MDAVQYKGLEVFSEAGSELFFGREKLVQDLIVRVKESRTVFVTGPSESGKSSLARDASKYAYIKNLYLKRFPEAQQCFSLGDFNLWELTPKADDLLQALRRRSILCQTILREATVSLQCDQLSSGC